MNIVPTTSQEREDATRIEQVAKKQKEYKLIGKQRKVAGHTLFEFNKTTKEIKPADIHRESVLSVSGKPTYKTRIDVREGCFYLQALNIKNAERKLRKLRML